MTGARRGARIARGAALGALGALGALVLGCDVPAPTTPPPAPGLVVFAVLDPGSAEQVVLLMQSRAAVPDVPPRPIDVNDPIVSSGETPVTGARVVLYGPAGDSVVAVEDRGRRIDRLGAGVYRVGNTSVTAGVPVFPVFAGRRYRLRVSSPVGDAEGTTLVPSAERVLAGATRNVSLARDSVVMPAGDVRAAGFVYSLRGAATTTTEGDAQYRRSLERRLILPSGGADWAFAYARERFRPGTRHTLTVTAADSNYFDYYAAQFDPFADRTARTTLTGAAGVFGSVVVIYSLPIAIVGP